MAIFRGRRGRLGDAMADMLMMQLSGSGMAPIAWANLTRNDNGLYFADVFNLQNGTMEAPGVVVFRTDSGQIVGWSQQAEPAYGAYTVGAGTDVSAVDYSNMVNIGSADAPTWISAEEYYWREKFHGITNEIMNDPSRVMTPDEYSYFFGKAYAGENLQALTDGWRTAMIQGKIAQDTGMQGFLNHVLPVILASAVVGGMVSSWAAATGASQYGPLSMAKEVAGEAFPGAFDWGVNPTDIDSVSGHGFGTPESLIDPATGGTEWIQNPTLPSIGEQAYQQTLAQGLSSEFAQQAREVAEALAGSGLSDADIIASAVDTALSSAAEGAVSSAGTIIGGGGTLINPASGAGGSFDIVGAPGGGKNPNAGPGNNNAGGNSPTPTPTTPPGGDTGGTTGGDTGGTTGGGITATDVIKTAGATIPVLSAGYGLVRQLTASDGTPWNVPYANVPGSDGYLPENSQPSTLASMIPWGLLIAGAIALTGN